jgi:hypothetical protein
LERLTAGILDSYATDSRTQRIGHTALPSHTTIVEILSETRQLLFPGYFGQKMLTQ